jgi:hypothetical protein
MGPGQELWYLDANRYDGCAWRRSGRCVSHVSAANGAASSITTACSRTTKPCLVRQRDRYAPRFDGGALSSRGMRALTAVARQRQRSASEVITSVCYRGNGSSRAHPRKRPPQAPADARRSPQADAQKPRSRRESPPVPTQPGNTKTGLSRRRSRVRVKAASPTRSHQGRTAMQNATKCGDYRHARPAPILGIPHGSTPSSRSW